jgi:hypothetical protein
MHSQLSLEQICKLAEEKVIELPAATTPGLMSARQAQYRLVIAGLKQLLEARAQEMIDETPESEKNIRENADSAFKNFKLNYPS